jgi:WD40 repeat protein/serine/threonine protein kinase
LLEFGFDAAKEPAAPTQVIASDTEKPNDFVGRYKLLDKVGEGGCGVVYVAEQTAPVRRRVALKVIKMGMDTKQVIARFEAERQALAMMDHPNIAKVLDAGTTESGRPYFMMELVRGIKFTDYCDQAKLSTKERLELFIKVCQAIQHAHQKGIIHRDIKPSNILVTLHDGVPVPKVIDFGIAKATEGKLTDATVYTQLHQFIGTPAYMSPEQAEMSGLDIDTRSDIYSLGVLLYELLVGSTPFDANELVSMGLDAMRKAIREKEPLRPSTRVTQDWQRLGSTGISRAASGAATEARALAEHLRTLINLLRGDLDWIVMKCLEKDRNRRYETANGLAADLKRHINNEPVIARPPSAAYKFQKSFRRNKLVFTAIGAVAAALLVGISVSVWQAARATQAKNAADAAQREQSRLRVEADRQRMAAEASAASDRMQRSRVEALAYSTDMNLVLQALQMNNLGRAQELLNRNRPRVGQPDRRGWEWRYLWNLGRGDEIATLGSHERGVTCVVFSRLDDLLASGDMDGKVRFWHWKERLADGQVEVGGPVQWVSFSPDDRRLAVRRSELGCQIWDISTRRPIDEFKDPAGEGVRIPAEFSPQGDVLAMSSAGGTIVLWNTHTHSTIATLSGHSAQVTTLVFSPDGRTLYSAADLPDATVRVWDLSTKREETVLKGHTSWISSLGLSPDESLLASSSGSGTVRIWDLKQRREKLKFAVNDPLAWDVKFSPDGRFLASCGADQRIHLQDTTTWQPVQTLKGHLNEIWSIAFSSSGKVLASGGKDGTVKLWSAEPEPATTHERSMPRGTMYFMPWSIAGRWFWVFQKDRVTLGNTRSLREVREFDLNSLQIDSSAITASMVNSTGQRLYLGDNTGAVCALELDTGRRTNLLKVPGTTVSHVVLSLDGKRLAIATSDGRVQVQDTGADHSLISLPSVKTGFNCLAFSPDGLLLAGGTHKEEILVWDVSAGSLRSRLSGHRDRLCSLAFSPEGSLLASGSWDGTAGLWDIASGTRLATLHGHLLGVNSVAFSPNGQRLVAGTGDGLIKLWNVADHQEVLTLTGHHDINYVGFLPGDETLVSGTEDSIQLWLAPSMEQINVSEANDNGRTHTP